MHTLTNGILKIEVGDLGAGLMSLYDLRAERELLWQGDPAWWGHRSPLLFPFVGTLTNGAYTFAGRSYEQTHHGFARELVFTRKEGGPDRIVHELVSDEATRVAYPFDFVLQVTHSLHGNRLRVEWDVRNTGENAMYFSIGAHPGFFCPLAEGERIEDCMIDFHTEGSIYRRMLDAASGRVFPGQRELPLENGRMALSAHTFDEHAIVLDDIPFDQLSLCGGDGKPYLTLHCPGFPYAGIWSPPGAPFVCLEPWFGRCNEMDASDEFVDRPGMMELAAGESWHASYDIEAEPA
jgi:galactose mutarotase-like enzyme